MSAIAINGILYPFRLICKRVYPGGGMELWEIERGPDGFYDVFRNGRVHKTAIDADEVREFFRRESVELEDVEGVELLS